MKNKIVAFLYRLIDRLDPKRHFVEANMMLSPLDKAVYAEQMLGNPIYKELINKIEADVLKLWKASKDVEDRERLHVHYMVLKQFDAYARMYVADAIVKNRRDKEAA